MLLKWGDMRANCFCYCMVLIVVSAFLREVSTESARKREERYKKCGWNVTTVGCPNDPQNLRCLSKDYLTCPPGKQYHCTRQKDNPVFYRDGCAISKPCFPGEAPYLVFEEIYGRPTTNLLLVCDKCHSTDYYNSEKERNSSSFFECDEKVRCYYPYGIECPSDRYKENRKCRCNTTADWILQDMSDVDDNFCSSVGDPVVRCVYAPCENGYMRSRNSTCVKKHANLPTPEPVEHLKNETNHQTSSQTRTTKTVLSTYLLTETTRSKTNEKTLSTGPSAASTHSDSTLIVGMSVGGVILLLVISVIGIIVFAVKRGNCQCRCACCNRTPETTNNAAEDIAQRQPLNSRTVDMELNNSPGNNNATDDDEQRRPLNHNATDDDEQRRPLNHNATDDDEQHRPLNRNGTTINNTYIIHGDNYKVHGGGNVNIVSKGDGLSGQHRDGRAQTEGYNLLNNNHGVTSQDHNDHFDEGLLIFKDGDDVPSREKTPGPGKKTTRQSSDQPKDRLVNKSPKPNAHEKIPTPESNDLLKARLGYESEKWKAPKSVSKDRFNAELGNGCLEPEIHEANLKPDFNDQLKSHPGNENPEPEAQEEILMPKSNDQLKAQLGNESPEPDVHEEIQKPKSNDEFKKIPGNESLDQKDFQKEKLEPDSNDHLKEQLRNEKLEPKVHEDISKPETKDQEELEFEIPNPIIYENSLKSPNQLENILIDSSIYKDLPQENRDELAREVLRKLHIDLVEKLPPIDVLDHFLKEKFISDANIRDIQNTQTDSDKNRRILDLVRQRGFDGYTKFKAILHRVNKDLYQSVLTEEETTLNEIRDNPIEAKMSLALSHVISGQLNRDCSWSRRRASIMQPISVGLDRQLTNFEDVQGNMVEEDRYQGYTQHQLDLVASKVLRRTHNRFVESLDPNGVLDHFMQEKFIADTSIRDIRDMENVSKQNRAVIEQVKSRGFDGYIGFQKILKTVNKDLLGRLLNEERKVFEDIKSNPDKYLEDKDEESSEDEQSEGPKDDIVKAGDEEHEEQINYKVAAEDEVVDIKHGHTRPTDNLHMADETSDGDMSIDCAPAPSHIIIDSHEQTDQDGSSNITASGQLNEMEEEFNLLTELIFKLNPLGNLGKLQTDSFTDFCSSAEVIEKDEYYKVLCDSLRKNWLSEKKVKDLSEILDLYCPAGYRRFKSTGDGNCLFNSVSILLFGTEKFSTFLRLCTAITAATNWKKYSKQFQALVSNPSFILNIIQTLEMKSFGENPDNSVQELIMKTARDGMFMGILHVYFLSDVIGREIIMHFQNKKIAESGKAEEHVAPVLSSKELTNRPIHILWVNSSGNDTDAINHIVPLMKKM